MSEVIALPRPSTVAAFWFLVRLADPQRLTAWLCDHPRDASALLKLLERK